MDPALTTTQLNELYQSYTTNLVNTYCPEKEITFRPNDKPYVNEKMKQIKRQTMREYEKHGKSNKYFELKQTFENKMISEAEKYKTKIVEEVVNGNRGSAYSALRKLGERPGVSNLTESIKQSNLPRSKINIFQTFLTLAANTHCISCYLRYF